MIKFFFAFTLAIFVLALSPSRADVFAAGFVVNSDNDVDDGTCDISHCSLREAIKIANITPGSDTISFNIPGSGFHSIHPGSVLPQITSPVIIDGATQPGFAGTPIIELDGSGAGDSANGLNITVGNSTVRGLVINRFGGTTSGNGIRLAFAGNNSIEGNYIGTDVTGTYALGNASSGVLMDANSNNNRIGGIAIGQRNVISGNGSRGVEMNGFSNSNLIQGNLVGTDTTGNFAIGNSAGVRISTSNGNVVGGSSQGARNIISGNTFQGILIDSGANSNTIQGNFIGTNITGNQVLPNSNVGILINNAAFGNFIGGTSADDSNVVSGNIQRGIEMDGSGVNDNQVKGNFIGTASDGINPLGNGEIGVFIRNSANNNSVGGVESGAKNVIAFNGRDGVVVASGTGNLLGPNSIYSNKDLGIDLNADGVTANDIGDADTGANNLQNYPLLISAISAGGHTVIISSLNSSFNSSFNVDFFSYESCDSSGFGEGKSFIGSKLVTTDSGGNVNFTAAFSVATNSGNVITATATDSGNNTSEFSRCIQVRTPSEAIGDLINTVEEFNLQHGIENSLDVKLANAQQALTDVNQNNNASAVSVLQAFINEVEAQRGIKITNVQADELVARAQAIINSLSS